MEPWGGKHFDGSKQQDAGEAVVEEAKSVEQVSQEVVERTQSHDGHDVGGVGEEWVASDGENRGDGVEGEDKVGEFDGDKAKEQDGDEGASCGTFGCGDKEAVLTEADRVDFGKPAQPDGGLFAGGIGVGHKETDGSCEKDQSEDIANPMEASEQG